MTALYIKLKKTNELSDLINDYYQKKLIQYNANGFIYSTNQQIINIIESLSFRSVTSLSNGSIKAEISFKINGKIYVKTIILDDIVEYTEYNYLVTKPDLINITIFNSSSSLNKELQQLYIEDKEKELEEWLTEIKILSYIRENML